MRANDFSILKAWFPYDKLIRLFLHVPNEPSYGPCLFTRMSALIPSMNFGKPCWDIQKHPPSRSRSDMHALSQSGTILQILPKPHLPGALRFYFWSVFLRPWSAEDL